MMLPVSEHIVLVPGVLALLPEYASGQDPVAELRAACLRAVSWLGAEVTVLADPQGARVARHLLAHTDREGDAPSYLVVGNGSACRDVRAPGFLDERATSYDAQLRRALLAEAPMPDPDLGRELLAALTGPAMLADRLPGRQVAAVDYDDDPFGVQYWVVRWTRTVAVTTDVRGSLEAAHRT